MTESHDTIEAKTFSKLQEDEEEEVVIEVDPSVVLRATCRENCGTDNNCYKSCFCSNNDFACYAFECRNEFTVADQRNCACDGAGQSMDCRTKYCRLDCGDP